MIPLLISELCITGTKEQSKTTILKMPSAATTGVQSLKQIQQTIKTEAGKLGEKITTKSESQKEEEKRQEKEAMQNRISEDVSIG